MTTASPSEPESFDVGDVPPQPSPRLPPEPPPVAAATQPAPPPAAEEKKRPGRPKKDPAAASAAAEPEPDPFAPPPGPEEPLLRFEAMNAKQRAAAITRWREGCPKDNEQAWPWVLMHCREVGWEASQITISVVRLSGDEKGEPAWLRPKIYGHQVMGNVETGVSPSDALEDWLITWYHKDVDGPATYRYRFNGPEGEYIVETNNFRREPYVRIMNRIKSMAAHERDRKPLTVYEPMARGWAQPTPGFAAPPGAPAAVAAAPAAVDASTHAELGYLRRVAEEFQRSVAEGRPPRPVEPPPPPPPPAAPAADAVRAEVGKAVADALLAAGIRPKTEEDRIRELLRENSEATIKAVVALYGPPAGAPGAPGAAVGAAGAPPAGSPGPPPTMTDVLKDIEHRQNELNEDKARARRVLGLPDEPPPVEHVPEVLGPALPDPPEEHFFTDLGKDLLTRAVKNPEGILAFMGSLFEGSPAGSMIQAAGAAAVAAKQAATQAGSVGPAHARGGGGGGTGNGRPGSS